MMAAVATFERRAARPPLPLVASLRAPPARGWSLARCLWLSLALHALLLLPWLLALNTAAPVPKPKDKLMVELFGMLAERQTEQAQAGQAKAPQPTQPRPPTPAAKPAPIKKAPPVRKVVTEHRQPSEVKTESPAEEVETAPPPTQGSEPEQQISQTIAHQPQDLDAQRRYLVALKKAVKALLSYPPSAQGAVGVAVVSFRLRADGALEEGTLQVRRSSGHAVLDQQALQVVRQASPFAAPPKAMTIALEMPFTVEKMSPL